MLFTPLPCFLHVPCQLQLIDGMGLMAIDICLKSTGVVLLSHRNR
jgi:hypothetical protein